MTPTRIQKIISTSRPHILFEEMDYLVGACLITQALRKHFDKEIESFAGNTRFTSVNSLINIKNKLNKNVSFYVRKFKNENEKKGAEKMYNIIKDDINEDKPLP